MPKMPPPALRELAKQRLLRLQESNPEEFAKEVEEARLQGYKVIPLGHVHYWIFDHSLIPEDGEKE